MSATEVQAILDGCERQRDRPWSGFLHETGEGMRIGQALGLRHSDIAGFRTAGHYPTPAERQRGSAEVPYWRIR